MTILQQAFRRLTLLLIGLLLLIAVIKVAPALLRRVYPLGHRDVIAREAELRDLDPNLVAAVINVESHWRADAVSPKGAGGLMQLMPSTAAWVAEQSGMNDFDQQDLFQPDVSIQLGTWYLANLMKAFEQNMIVALAAYNGGRGNVEHWLQDGLWDGTLDDVDQIPFGETRRYVRKVLNQYQIYARLYQWKDKS